MLEAGATANTTVSSLKDSNVLLRVRGLRTTFDSRDGAVHAVSGISYDVAPGEALGIVGESGCGKSVSALSLMRLLPEPPAQVEADLLMFAGQDLLALSRDELPRIRGKQIAMIFQDASASLNPVLTVGQQIAEALVEHLGFDQHRARTRAIELLQFVGIPAAEERLSQYPHQFSGGMRQRVMIAMAISCNPQLLIADEPTTALDVTIQAQILDLLRNLRRELGMALILITHDLGVVASMCDRVLVMYAGHIVEAAPTRELFRRPSHPYTLGLLRSIPRIDQEVDEELASIEGSPPDLAHLPPGCPFADRCPFAYQRCRGEIPPLEAVTPGHVARCWIDVQTGKPR